MTRASHVLVYRCGTLGDTLVALPAMRALRAALPRARLTLMTANDGGDVPWTDDVVRDLGIFDGVLTYRSADLLRLPSLLALAGRVRRLRADLVVHLASDRNSALRLARDRAFFAIAGIRRAIVPRPSAKVTALGRLKPVAGPLPYEVDRLLAALAPHGLADDGVRFDLPARADDSARAASLLGAVGADGRALVALCPGSKQPSKRWPAERWHALALRLAAEENVNVVVVGGADEAAIGATIEAALPPGRCVVAAGRASILESAAVLRRARLYVGNDTGAMHLAAAVGTPCVAIFAAREPARSWHPYGDDHVVLRRDDVGCAPCYRSVCPASEGLRCLTSITVDDVADACRTVLGRQAPVEGRIRCAG